MKTKNFMRLFVWIIVLSLIAMAGEHAQAKLAGATVKGCIVDNNAAPIANAEVRFNISGQTYAQKVVAGANGCYNATGVLAGNQYVHARLGTAYAYSHIWSLPVVEGGVYNNVNFTLRPGGGRISGRVMDASGTGLADIMVRAWENTTPPGSHDNGAFAQTKTDANGYYVTDLVNAPGPGLPSGNFMVTFYHLGQTRAVDNVWVTAGQETKNIDMVVSSGTGVIQGRVTDALTGQPISSAKMYADNTIAQVSAFTNADGVYQMGSLPTGTYNVVVWKDGYANAHQYNISVLDGQTSSNVDFALTTSQGIIRGRVTNLSGTPIANAQLVADSLQGSGFGNAKTDTNGYYEMKGLAPMKYDVHAAAQGYASRVQPATASDGQITSGIDFVLGTAAGGFSGRILKDGQPAPYATVFINSSAGEPVMYTGGQITDANGDYTVTGLPAGKYDIHVYSVPGYTNQVIFNVVLGNTITGGMNFNLTNGSGAIFGTVTDTSGNPVPNATVQAFQLQNPGTWGSTITDAQGHYSLNGLWSGNYTLYVYHPKFPDFEKNNLAIPAGGLKVDVVLGQVRALFATPSEVSVLVTGRSGTTRFLNIDVTTGEPTTWHVTTSAGWLRFGASGDVHTYDGVTGEELQMRFDPTNLPLGVHTTTIHFTTPDQLTLDVTVILLKVDHFEYIFLPLLQR